MAHPDAPYIDYPPLADEDLLKIISVTVSAYRDISSYALGRMLERMMPSNPHLQPIPDDSMKQAFAHIATA